MQWAQIKEQAELYRRDQVYYPKRWFNEGKHLLANMYPTACKVLTASYIVTDINTVEDLPSDYKYLHKIVLDGYPRDKFEDFTIDVRAKTICFDLPGTFTVHYLVETADVVGTDSEVPEIDSAYHYPLAKFIAAKELEYIRDLRHQALLKSFFTEAEAAHKAVKRGYVGTLRIRRGVFR